MNHGRPLIDPEHPQRPKRVVAVVNAGGGSVEREGGGSVRTALETGFQRHGVATELQLIAGEEIASAIRSAAERAARGEIDAVVVGGGDGTIRTGAGILAGTGIAMG